MNEIVTERLKLNIAKIQELEELEIIEKECIQYFSFDPQCNENHTLSIKECVLNGDIPEGGKKENYYFYCIRKNNVLIGFIDFYLEYIKKDSAYITSIYIKQEYQKHGFGKEILNSVIEKFSETGIKEIYLHCSLRNTEALKFWVKNGFNIIVNIESNGNLFPNNFGGIELMKKI